jgi:hypothetical protein
MLGLEWPIFSYPSCKLSWQLQLRYLIVGFRFCSVVVPQPAIVYDIQWLESIAVQLTPALTWRERNYNGTNGAVNAQNCAMLQFLAWSSIMSHFTTPVTLGSLKSALVSSVIGFPTSVTLKLFLMPRCLWRRTLMRLCTLYSKYLRVPFSSTCGLAWCLQRFSVLSSSFHRLRQVQGFLEGEVVRHTRCDLSTCRLGCLHSCKILLMHVAVQQTQPQTPLSFGSDCWT